MDQIDWLPSKLLYPVLHRWWDGGGLPIAGTVAEGDEVAGFKVYDFPGHAPGMIGLFRSPTGSASAPTPSTWSTR